MKPPNELSKSQKGLIAVIAVSLCVLIFQFYGRSARAGNGVTGDHRTPVKVAIPVETKKVGGVSKNILKYKDAKGQAVTAEITDSQKSIITMSRAFIEFANPSRTPEDLVGFLRSLNLNPLKSLEQPKNVASFVTVRTRQSLPGIRYIHAQYDDLGEAQLGLQMLSFEVPPSPTAMKDTVELMGKVMDLGELIPDTADGFTVFRNNGFLITFNRLDLEDLRGDPVNAYESADAGTIRVAIARDPGEF